MPPHSKTLSMASLRRILAIAAFAAILVGGVQTYYLRMYTVDRAAFGRALAVAQYRRMPGLRTFLMEVRERTDRGDVIALVVPATRWAEGYEYAYSRSIYHLVGRRVVPLVDRRDDSFLWRNLVEADYVAAWNVRPEFAGFELSWQGPNGVLLRRSR